VLYSGGHSELGWAKHPLGGYWLTGHTWTAALTIKRVDADMQLLAAANFGINAMGSGVVATSTGGALAVGRTTSALSGGYDGWVIVVDAGVNLLHETSSGSVGADDLQGVVQGPAGIAVAAGHKTVAGYADGWLVALDEKANVLWQRTYGGAGSDRFFAIAALPDGGFLLAGSTTSSGAGLQDGWLVRTDKWGNVHWQRSFGTGGSEFLSAVTLRPDLGLAAVGLATGKAWLLRADAWGNTTCTSGGACLDLGIAGCDDKNPCTQDICNPVAGCQHSAFAVGTRCGETLACDKTGACALPLGMQPVAQGPFWMGCVSGDAGCGADEKPQHLTTLAAYFIDLEEVTVDAYAKCVQAGTCSPPPAFKANAAHNWQGSATVSPALGFRCAKSAP